MYDTAVSARECETCARRGTMQCPNSALCYDTSDKPHWQGVRASRKKYVTIICKNRYVQGVVGQDIRLKTWQRIRVLFCGGITVALIGRDVTDRSA